MVLISDGEKNPWFILVFAREGHNVGKRKKRNVCFVFLPDIKSECIYTFFFLGGGRILMTPVSLKKIRRVLYVPFAY